jgi:hypothetical protein
MPRLRHFYGEGHYHYLTENIYRRARIFDSDRCKRKFIQTPDDLRTELGDDAQVGSNGQCSLDRGLFPSREEPTVTEAVTVATRSSGRARRPTPPQ